MNAASTTSATTAVATGSVMFSDLVGFTEFNDVRGDDAALGVLEGSREVMDVCLEGVTGARVVKELGDGLMVWIPAACDAVDVATRLVGHIGERRADGSFPLSMRVGIHHGDVRERGDDLVGMTVNVAARIVDQAGPSEIVVSEAVVAACHDHSSFEAIGPVTVKGVSDPLWLYRVSGG
jgi:adenylate cyclase